MVPVVQYPLSQDQRSLIESPLTTKVFLEGPAGTGKTTVAVERLRYLLEHGVPSDSILLLLPQLTLAGPYTALLQSTSADRVTLTTFAGLAQRLLEMFWRQVAGDAGFAFPDQPPVFLNLETAEYFMAHVLRPHLDEGLFKTVTLERSRLYTQILESLNHAAVAGFPITEIGARLKSAWLGDPAQLRIYEDVQFSANLFRSFCLQHNLVDFSLLAELFRQHLWHDPVCHDYLLHTYRHLLVDNVEEDAPVVHDMLREWLPSFDSALIIYDQEAGFRSLLGADPVSAVSLHKSCDQHIIFQRAFVASPPLQTLEKTLGAALDPAASLEPPASHPVDVFDQLHSAMEYEQHHFYPQMLDWVASRVRELVVRKGVPPSQIAVLTPYLSEGLRFAIQDRLERDGIQVRAHRPSHTISDEPLTAALLTWASLAHPDWGFVPSRYDLADALVLSIEELDLVRAHLLADSIASRGDLRSLLPFDEMTLNTQERVTQEVGERYEILRKWLEGYAQQPEAEFDRFLSRLVSEVLAQPGFRLYVDPSLAEVAANLIESAQNFQHAVSAVLQSEGKPVGKEYCQLVKDGLVAAQYLRLWEAPNEDAVTVAPAFNFVLANRPVDYQIWVDVGSYEWADRPDQLLTHSTVLSRNWTFGRVWTDEDEVRLNQELVHRLVLGLLRRCRKKVFLGISELSEPGYEQRGPLVKAVQRSLREAAMAL